MDAKENISPNLRDDFSSKDQTPPTKLSSIPYEEKLKESPLSKEFELDQLKRHVEAGFTVLKKYSETVATKPDSVLLNDFIGSIANGTNISEIPPESIAVLEKVADHCLANKEWEDAYGVFTLLILSAPTNSNYWFQKALAMHFSGEYHIALSSINVALILEPSQPEFHLLKSAESLLLNDKDQALASLKKAKELLGKPHEEMHPDWTRWQNLLENQLIPAPL